MSSFPKLTKGSVGAVRFTHMNRVMNAAQLVEKVLPDSLPEGNPVEFKRKFEPIGLFQSASLISPNRWAYVFRLARYVNGSSGLIEVVTGDESLTFSNVFNVREANNTATHINGGQPLTVGNAIGTASHFGHGQDGACVPLQFRRAKNGTLVVCFDAEIPIISAECVS